MSRSKAQGTAFESWVEGRATDYGLISRRLAEGGSRDEGDVEMTWHAQRPVIGPDGPYILTTTTRVVAECRFRASMSPHMALFKHRRKVGNKGIPVLIWKRLTRKDDHLRRTPVGEPIIVCLAFDDFMALIGDDS